MPKPPRVANFPYAAIEEALANAIYHRSYEEREPVEVRISAEELVVFSYPQARRGASTEVTGEVTPVCKALKDSAVEQIANVLGLPPAQVTAQVTAQVVEVLSAAVDDARTRAELQSAAGIKHREHFRKTYTEPLVSAGWLEQTIPDKPTSRLQKYRLTEKGRAWLAAQSQSGGND